MSGIYANNLAAQMPVVWEEEGVAYRGQVYAIEGEVDDFVLLVIAQDDRIQRVSVRDNNVRLDKEAINASQVKAEADVKKAQILQPGQ